MLPLRIKAPGSNAEPGVFCLLIYAGYCEAALYHNITSRFFVRHVKFDISAGNIGCFAMYDRHQLVDTERLI